MERAADSMPPPPARKDIVLALRAPGVVPGSQPKGRKRKFTKGGDGESSQQGDSSIASGLRGKSETPPTLEAEEARLSGCKGDLAVVDGDFNLILADLKSACFLPTCSEGPEGKDPVLGEGGGDAAPGFDEATGEEGA
ncbi:hypothetical protein F2Q70_00035850 [Brassica cretica]|uniref:Uncharacterized protein n=1 Tax=Brassica cretica TaxID=69181 RepID=A0A8S9JXI6_BRACR|nr:hypothetical protein F2Q70_00035850 [Brassica cretica]